MSARIENKKKLNPKNNIKRNDNKKQIQPHVLNRVRNCVFLGMVVFFVGF